MFIGHLGDGIVVGAVKVNNPEFWNYSCGLGLDGLEVTLAEPTVHRVIRVACCGDNMWYDKCIGDSFKFLFKL